MFSEEQTPAEAQRTLEDLLKEVSELKPDALNEDEVEKVYEALSNVTELIEAMVVEQLKEELSLAEEAN